MKRLLILTFLALGILAAQRIDRKSHGHGGGGSPPPPPPVNCSFPLWCVLGEEQGPFNPTPTGNGGLEFAFPPNPDPATGGYCNASPLCYPVIDLYSVESLALVPGQTVTVNYEVQASNAIFGFNTFPGAIGPGCLQTAHFMYVVYFSGYRYFQWPPVDMPNGTYDTQSSVKVLLVPSNFIDVNGQHPTESEFASALSAITKLDLGIGGGCSAAHGAYMDQGNANFILYQVIFQ